MKPKVSVCVPTYNHEAYIAQMIEGALMQKTNFDYEIVIGDDGSTDGSVAIIQRYAIQYPDLIRAYLHPQNLGPAEPREFAGRNNVLHLLKACRGQYVALCEGDDYWTDPAKLQQQADVLDAQPDYAICHHNMTVKYEDGSASHFFNADNQKISSHIEDILEDRWFIATASLMYRNIFLSHDFADWHAKAAAGDWALVIQIAARGKIYYLPEPMGVYRKHSAGLSNVHAVTNRYFLQNRKEMFENINAWLDYKYDDTIQATIKKYEQLLT
jgi:glycosyltransferase involved in cell wall biosynthesis